MSINEIMRWGPEEEVVLGAIGAWSSAAGPKCSVSVRVRLGAAVVVEAGGCDCCCCDVVADVAATSGCVWRASSNTAGVPGVSGMALLAAVASRLVISTGLFSSSDSARAVLVVGREAPATASCDDEAIDW